MMELYVQWTELARNLRKETNNSEAIARAETLERCALELYNAYLNGEE